MIVRNDLKPNATTITKELRESIKRFGGTNPHGEPLFRLCRAEDRISKAAGAWNIFDENTSVEDRGGLGVALIQKMLNERREILAVAHRALSQHEFEKMKRELDNEVDDQVAAAMKEVAPLRVDRGVVDVEVYHVEGWILEKWYPADHFGSRDEWERFTFQGELALGLFPSMGAYELLSGPTPYLPTIAQVEEVIRQNFHDIDTRPASPRERVARMLARREQRRAQIAREQKNKAESFQKDLAPLMNRLSLGAGLVRQDLARRAGLRGHYGN